MSDPIPEIHPDLRYDDRCPNCHCYMALKTRIRTGTEDILEWFKVCTGCHAEFVVLVERMP
jgi:hypothetical protein